MNSNTSQLKQCRIWIGLFISALVLSGVTAIPLVWELDLLAKILSIPESGSPHAADSWIGRVRDAVHIIDRDMPFVGYGFDWLAFGHVIIALFMVGAWIDPVQNKWLFTAAKIACLAVIPWALAFGELRGIPLGWRLIDCSFGILGLLPLHFAETQVRQLKKEQGDVSVALPAAAEL
ncbi:MAG: hypothetical protein ACPGVU_25565 [Limisphaerales bacterium]